MTITTRAISTRRPGVRIACHGEVASSADALLIRWGLVEPVPQPIVGLPRGVTVFHALGAAVDLDTAGAVRGAWASHPGDLEFLLVGIRRLAARAGLTACGHLPVQWYHRLPPHLQVVTMPRCGGLVDHRDAPRLAGLERFRAVTADGQLECEILARSLVAAKRLLRTRSLEHGPLTAEPFPVPDDAAWHVPGHHVAQRLHRTAV